MFARVRPSGIVRISLRLSAASGRSDALPPAAAATQKNRRSRGNAVGYGVGVVAHCTPHSLELLPKEIYSTGVGGTLKVRSSGSLNWRLLIQ